MFNSTHIPEIPGTGNDVPDDVVDDKSIYYSNILIGGMPGSGKSVPLWRAIANAAVSEDDTETRGA